jgi:glycosyltransferase involved in cell wall biosynthesis
MHNCSPVLAFIVNVDWFFYSHRLAIAEKATQEGFEVILITKNTGLKELIENKGIKFYDLNITRSGLNVFKEVTLCIELILLLNKIRPDIIHNVSLKPILYGSIAARFLKTTKIVNAFSGLGYSFTNDNARFSRYVIGKVMKFIFKNKTISYIFQNKDDYDELKSLDIFNKHSRIYFIKGSGVDLSRFNKTLFPPFDKIIILFVARLLWDKGVKELYDSTQRLKEKYSNKIEFIIAGKLDNENRSGVPQEFIENWCEYPFVQWVGHTDKIEDLFSKSHIVVLPSYREGIPRSLIEACASGRAIITTNAIGCKDCVDQGVNGLLVPVGNSEELEKAIITLYNNHELIRKMGNAGRNKAILEFDLNSVINQHFVIYHNLLN